MAVIFRNWYTATDQMMGTLDYMAPEQGAHSHDVDIRADIYSLGATLYKLLCGEAPFAGRQYNTPIKKMMALATETPVPIDQRRIDFPEGLAAIVDRMMARDPDDRYRAPQEVAEAIEPFTDGCDLIAVAERISARTGQTAQESASVGTTPQASSASADTTETVEPPAVPDTMASGGRPASGGEALNRHLPSLPKLEHLALEVSGDADLAPLGSLGALRTLQVLSERVTGAGMAHHLRELPHLTSRRPVPRECTTSAGG